MNWHGRQECQKISIHAPAEGATVDAFVANAEVQNFNPRSRGGSDFNLRSRLYRITDISIHAPAEGATSGGTRRCNLTAISIHAPAEGATIFPAIAAHTRIISIHAPAEGATNYILEKSE